MESPKSWSLTDYFCPKNRLLQLKHYIQRIYLTLLSTTYVKIHQIASVICETKSSLLRHNFSVFFSSNITYFLQKQPIKEHIFRLSTARVKVHQIPDDIFQIKSQFFFKVWIFFSVMKDNSSVLFQLKRHMLLTKAADQCANFQSCHCSH